MRDTEKATSDQSFESRGNRDVSFPSWLISPLIELDALAPGVITRALAGNQRTRQAIYCSMAFVSQSRCVWQRNTGWSRWLARQILTGSPADIIRSTSGSCPDGLVGALERIGPDAFGQPSAYLVLHGLFGKGPTRHERDALRYCGAVREATVDVLQALDSRWVHANILNRLMHAEHALAFNSALAFLQSASTRASDAAIRAAISNLRKGEGLSQMLARFARRADCFPSHPSGTISDIVAIESAAHLISAARRYRNCLRRRLLDALSGNTAYAEFRGAAILEFRRLSVEGGWLLYGVHGPSNRDVGDSLRADAEAALAKLGISRMTRRLEGAGDLRAFKNWVEADGVWDWMF